MVNLAQSHLNVLLLLLENLKTLDEDGVRSKPAVIEVSSDRPLVDALAWLTELQPDTLVFARAFQNQLYSRRPALREEFYDEIRQAAEEAHDLGKSVAKWGEAYGPESILVEAASAASHLFRAAQAGGALGYTPREVAFTTTERKAL